MKYPNIVKPDNEFGTYGSTPGTFNDPMGLSVGPDGNLYVADTLNHRVQVLDPQGEPLRSWGTAGAVRGHLIAPEDLGVAPDGSIYVADTGNDRVQVFRQDGRFLASWGRRGTGPGDFNSPCGVAVDGERVYVVDRQNERIQVFDHSGRFLLQFGRYGTALGEFNQPHDLAVDGQGNIYVADSYNNRVQKFDSSGRAVAAWGDWGSYAGLLATPTGLSFARGELYVADLINHRIQVFDAHGRFLYQWGRHPAAAHEGAGRLHYPSRIAAAPSGEFIAVLEPFENRIQIFRAGAVQQVVHVDDSAWWDKATRFHYGEEKQAKGKILAVAEPDTHAVLVFDITEEIPRLITKLGGQGRALGQFIRPTGLHIDDKQGLIYVSDSGNHRLQVFQLQRSQEDPKYFVPNAASFVRAIDFKRPEVYKRLGKNKELIEPSGITRDRAGNFLVADPKNARILVLNPSLEIVRAWGEAGEKEGQFRVPLHMAFNRKGDVLYVVDTYNFRVQAFSPDGKFLFTWGRPGVGPSEFVHAFDVEAGKDGFVYVSDDGANRIQKFDERGKYVTAWGRWGTEAGQFYKPKGVAQDDRGRVFVADFGNHRGQIFTAAGEFVAMFGIGAGYTPPLTLPEKSTVSGGEADRSDRMRTTPGEGRLVSNGGHYQVRYAFGSYPIPLNEPIDLTVSLAGADGEGPPESLSVDAVMPGHYHGVNRVPVVSRQSDGTYRVEGLQLHMPGRWELHFDAAKSGITERAQLEVVVE